jgi:hypothetical protein
MRDVLVGKLGGAMSKLAPGLRAQLTEYINLSYDRSKDIAEAISRHPGGPSLVLESQLRPTQGELMEIARSCQPDVLSRVAGLLTGLRVIHEAAGMPSLPTSMGPAETFSLLPHLILSGTMFSQRPAMILALLAKLTGSILQDEAHALLSAKRGSWIDRTLPENNSFGFARLLLRAPEYLFEKEHSFYGRLSREMGLKNNALKVAPRCHSHHRVHAVQELVPAADRGRPRGALCVLRATRPGPPSPPQSRPPSRPIWGDHICSESGRTSSMRGASTGSPS